MRVATLDLESASYERDRDDYAATERLLSRRSQARIWLMEVRQRAAYHLGPLQLPIESAHGR